MLSLASPNQVVAREAVGSWSANGSGDRGCYESRHLPGRLKVRAVQISGLVDSVALILLDKLVLQPGVAEPGCGERGG